MGAINFAGGSWCGGGYGKLFTRDLFVSLSDICSHCGESEENCTCGDFDTYENEYLSQLFEKYKKSLDEIEDRVIFYLKEKKPVSLPMGNRNYTLSMVLRDMKDNYGCDFLTIQAGYYEGFQIYFDNYAFDDYLIWDDDIVGEVSDEQVQIVADIVNGILADDEFEWDYCVE